MKETMMIFYRGRLCAPKPPEARPLKAPRPRNPLALGARLVELIPGLFVRFGITC